MDGWPEERKMIPSLFSVSGHALRWGGFLPGLDSLYIIIIAYASIRPLAGWGAVGASRP